MYILLIPKEIHINKDQTPSQCEGLVIICRDIADGFQALKAKTFIVFNKP